MLAQAALHVSPGDPNVLGWQAWGCFASPNMFNGILDAATVPNTILGMSPQICIGLCVSQGEDYSAVIGESCYCSSEAPPPADGSTRCNAPCTADKNAVCGNPAYGAFSFFRRIVTTLDPPSDAFLSISRRTITALEQVPEPANPSPGGWQYSGCFFANDFIATSPFSYVDPEGMDAAQCSALASINGYTYAGLRDNVCYASNASPATSLEAGPGLCATACTDYPTEACGGSTSPVNTGAQLTQLVTLYSRLSPSFTADPLIPDTNTPTAPNGWFDRGCYNADQFVLDSVINGQRFSYALDAVVDNSAAKCISQCSAIGFDYAVTVSSTCYCNSYPPSLADAAQDQGQCNTPCPTNPEERCGGEDVSDPNGGVLGNVYSRLAIGSEVRLRLFLHYQCALYKFSAFFYS